MTLQDFDPAERFVAGTVGPAGQRAFYLQASEGPRVVTVGPGEAAGVGARRPHQRRARPARPGGGGRARAARRRPRGHRPAADARSTRTSGCRPSRSRGTRSGSELVIECHDHDPDEVDEEEPPAEDVPLARNTLRVSLEPAAARAFARRSNALVAAGRPPVPVLRGAARPDRAHLPAGQWLQTLSRRPRPLTSPASSRWWAGSPARRTSRSLGCDCCRAVGGEGRTIDGPMPVHVIYKPVRGERPLWDFPDGTLAGREVAAAVVSELGGWHLVPPTVLRDGPLGPGSVQLWIGDPYRPAGRTTSSSTSCPRGARRRAGTRCMDGETPTGRAVTVVHSGADDVRSLAVLDAAINNSDRKGVALPARPRRPALGHRPRRQPVGRAQAAHRAVGLGGGAAARRPSSERLERLLDVLATPGGSERLGALLPEHDVAALVGAGATGCCGSASTRTRAPGWPAVPWPPL